MKKRIACLMLALVMLIGLIPAAAISASAAGVSVSEAGIRVIKEYMGFQKNAYKVDEGVYKIGYGTPSVEGATITEANADKYLREKLAEIESVISPKITVDLVQKRMDALVWYSYVEGTAWTASSAFVSAINGNVTGSELVDLMCTWDYDSTGFPDDTASRSVISRRLAMANLYLNGVYSAADTGSLGYTVFDAGENATFPGTTARKMVQAFVGGTVTAINVADPNYDPSGGTVKFLGWYTGNAMVTGVGPATNGQVLTARWQLPEDDKVFANYTLPAYVIYEANGISDTDEVPVYKAPNEPVKIDVVNRDSVVTVVAETSLGGQKWLQLSTGGWVKLCSNLSDVPVIIPSVTVTITDDYVNVRQQPSVTATKLGTLRRGESRTIAMLSSDLKWGYCSEGWIFLAYTDYNDKSSSGGTSLGAGTPGTVTGASKVNVRVAPGVSNALATTLAEGTAVTVYEQQTVDNAAWGHIDQGWISMNYVKLSQTTQSGSSISTGSSAVVSSSVSLNVRSGPGTGYSKVGCLAPGTSVVILRKETVGGVAWGLIDQGWINLNYVTVTASSGSTGSGSTYGVDGTVVNCSSGVNVRSAAGTYNALVGVAALGSRVTVTELVEVNGHSWGNIGRGWVCMDYIQLDSEFNAPTNDAQGDGLDNVVTTFEGYPAVTIASVDLLETASAHAKSLLTLNSGVDVNILAWSQTGENLYGKVTVGSKTGWINLAYVNLKEFNAKVTAAKSDVYELPNVRSKFYASLVQGTYVTIPATSDNSNWTLSDGTLWGMTTVTVSGVTYTGWLKMADLTMFKDNTLPTGITTLSGVGYLTGTLNTAATVMKDQNGNVTTEATAYTLTAGTSVNILARNYVSGTTYGKVTVGSVTGWIPMSAVTLDAVAMKAGSDVKAFASAADAVALGAAYNTISAGNRFTVTDRILVPDPNEINHGIVDVGFGYLNDNPADTCYMILDDGKLVPTGSAVTTDPSNPSVVSSVVITGTANGASGYVAIYEEAVVGSTQLLQVSNNTNVTILNWKIVNGKTWGKVQINKIVGWVDTSEISFSGLKGLVAVESLYVYNNADKSSTVQVLRVNNKPIEVYSVYFDGTTVWGMITVTDKSGWIDLADVTLNTPGANYTPELIIATGKINSVNASINMAETPAGSAGEVTTLPKGTEVDLLKVSMSTGSAWWLVDMGDKDGWVSMECLTLNSAIATITRASAPIYDDLTLVKTLYTLYRDEKVTVLSFKTMGGVLYGEVAYGDTTGWIEICDAADNMFVSLTPGSTGSTIGGSTGSSSDSTTPTTPATSEPIPAYIVCSSTVNVRSGAGVQNTLVTTLSNGTNIKIYEQTTVLGKQWARIDQGWVCMDYVQLGTQTTGGTGTGTGTGSGTPSIVYTVPSGAIAVGYASQDIKIRSGSGLGYPEVGTVSKGNSVVIYENKLDGGMSWGRTDSGWICTSYLTITGIGATGSGDMGTIGGVGFTANVRLTANSGSALMAKAMVSARVVVRETMVVGSETWARTDLGWINAQYVVMDSAAAPVPGETTSTEATTAPEGDGFVG